MFSRRLFLSSSAAVAALGFACAEAEEARKPNRVLAREYLRVLDTQGAAASAPYRAADAKYHRANHTGAPVLSEGLYAGFPDLIHIVVEQVAEGEDVVQRVRYFATHTGPYMGIAATGRKLTFSGLSWMRFKDGKLSEQWGVVDEHDIRRQLTGQYTQADIMQANKAVDREGYEVIDRWNDGGKGPIYGGPMHGSRNQGLGKTFPHYTAFPDYTHLVHDQIAEGDTVVQRIQYFCTQKDWFMGVAPTGKRVSYTGMDWARFKAFSIMDRYGVADSIGLYRQLLGEVVLPESTWRDWPWMVKARA